MAEHAEVWVLTRSANRGRIERELAERPLAGLHFVYYDPPLDIRHVGSQLHYLWWQQAILPTAQRAHHQVGFDVAHHVSYVRYWTPSLLSELPIPFVWGPVGGAEATRLDLDLGTYGRAFEGVRQLVLRLAACHPLVHRTARRSAVALAASDETAERVRRLGASDVRAMSPVGAPEDTLLRGRGLDADGSRSETGPVFTSVTGRQRLMHWKGVQLGIRAFAEADLPGGAYHVFGSGRQRERLQRLARELGVADRVHFWGDVTRAEMLDVLERSHALVHPGIHDPGATVIPEAMALGVPVLCLDAGGPAVLVDEDTGFLAPFGPLDASVAGLTEGMRRLAGDPELLRAMRAACFERARGRFSWPARAERYLAIYREALARSAVPSTASVVEQGMRS